MLGNSIVSLLFTLTSQHGEMRICVHTSTEIRTHDPRASAAFVFLIPCDIKYSVRHI
jgi:hypothetical protein